MTLLIDTTRSHAGAALVSLLEEAGREGAFTYVDTTQMNIAPCCGCNYCWLKTPGICSIKDDHGPLLRQIHTADRVWFITDTKFGFVSFQTKNLVDRLLPLATMNLHFKNKQMRHIMRYAHTPDLGILYTGEGDREYLTRWCERVAINFDSRSLGVFPAEEMKEAVTCI